MDKDQIISLPDDLVLSSNPVFVAKNIDGSEYIPIGPIEMILDKLYVRWGTHQWKFVPPFELFGRLFISGSVILETKEVSKDIELMVGAKTMEVLASDLNTDYEATLLSMCIANAAKRKGVVFGRALNNRLVVGENVSTRLPDKQVKADIKKEKMAQENDEAFTKAKEAILSAKDKIEATEAMISHGFRYNAELKSLINKQFKK